MGIDGAQTYAEIIQFGKTYSVSALEKAITTLESIIPFSYTTERLFTIERALVKIYQKKPDFVIDIFRNRLKNIPGLYLMEDHFLREIVKIDNQPLIKMIQSEINLDNPKIMGTGEGILRKCFLTPKECIFSCENNYYDKRKQELIIQVLKEILSNGQTTYDDSSNEDVIKLTKRIVSGYGLDYEKYTKNINNDKKGRHQETIKALSILEKIQEVMENPTLDIEQLNRNLKYMPNIVKVFGEE